jgi:SAM-dependent methyltransferase
MKKKEKDELFASQLPGILQYHQTMLADGVRNKLLSEAIKMHVTSETAFLDIGAGTGIWAILAAKLGAKKVVAVEIEESLIPVIFRHAQENGVADKIEIIHGNSDDVRIRGKFDVIVSELFGQDALGEQTVKSFVSLRNRFLAPNGKLIPQKMAMLAAPVHIENSVHNIPADLPVKCDFLKSLKLNYSWNAPLSDRQKIKFLAASKELIEIDFRNIETAPSLKNVSLSWQVDKLAEANAVAVFNCSTFTDEIIMDNFASQSWGTSIYEFQPFAEDSGELKFDLTIDDKKSIWTVTLPSNNEVKPKTYSPSFAVTRIKMAQQMTPHRRFKPTKTTDKNAKTQIKAKKM